MNLRKDRLSSDYDVVSACEDTEEGASDFGGFATTQFSTITTRNIVWTYKYMNNNNNREGGIYNGCIRPKTI